MNDFIESTEEGVGNEKNESERYFFTYEETEEGSGAETMADKILNDKRLPEIKYITIGYWGECYEDGPDPILKMFAENKEKFQHLVSLFVGDMDYEECEISWIQQGGYEALLKGLPNLKILKIKGSEGLTLGEIDHANLEELHIICGGLPVDVVNSLKTARLPALKKLVLYVGVDGYGRTCTLNDLAGLAKKDLFPNLKYLGFLDSEDQDELVEVILNSDILPQLDTVDISCGCLTDKGGRMIMDAQDKLTGLKTLNANYHFMSKGMMEELKTLPFEVNAGDAQVLEPSYSPEYISPMITE